MALPETTVVRRKDILNHLGITRRRFYELIEQGLIRPHQLRDQHGKPCGNPMYLREDVERFEATLKGAMRT